LIRRQKYDTIAELIRGFCSLRQTVKQKSSSFHRALSNRSNTSIPSITPQKEGEERPLKTYLQVSDFLTYILACKEDNEELPREYKLFLIDFLPHLQHIMDYDASVEVLLSADLEEYIFAACSEKCRHGLLVKYEFQDVCDPIGEELTQENL
jgi:hypothetical protein